MRLKNIYNRRLRIIYLCILQKKQRNTNTITKTDTGTNPSTTDVYVSGNAINSIPASVAICWKISEAITLADTNINSYAYSITTSGADVYIACSVNQSAGYWKNGSWITLPGNYAAGIGVAVSGSDVYVVGYSTTAQNDVVATVWKNGVPPCWPIIYPSPPQWT